MISASSHLSLRARRAHPSVRRLGIALLAALALASCGGSDAPAASTPGTGDTATTTGGTGEATSGTAGEGTASDASASGAADGDAAAQIAALEDRVAALEAAVVQLTGAGAGTATDGAPAAEGPATEDTTAPADEAASAEPPHWDYTAPDSWGSLSPDYAACDTGTAQSPINLVEPEAKDLEDATYDYVPSAATIVDNGHTVQVNLEAGGSMWLDGVEYRLVQLHFHGPSEHTVDGESYPMEIHFVHKSADGAIAVVGVLVEIGDANPAWDDLIASLPTEVDTETTLGFDVDANVFMPEIRAAYRYQGSLTTPPCTEGVEWQVLIATTTMSGQQIDAIRAEFPEANNRPVQPLGDRELDVDLSW